MIQQNKILQAFYASCDLAEPAKLTTNQYNRLIFEPADNPIPIKPDGRIDWKKVTAIKIIGVEDTHE